MKTLQQVKELYKSKTIDFRDILRLAQFIPEKELKDFGISLKGRYVGRHEHKPFTRENILKQLEEDVDFGAEKAYNERSISSYQMYEVVRMWNWILEEGLEKFDNFYDYGMPLFKETAEKYNFDISKWLK